MPTTKNRINLSVSDEVSTTLKKLALRDHVSVSAKTLDLVYRAMEIEEDVALLGIVKERENAKTKFVIHDQAWL